MFQHSQILVNRGSRQVAQSRKLAHIDLLGNICRIVLVKQCWDIILGGLWPPDGHPLRLCIGHIMALFNFGKKKEVKKETGCCCGSTAPKAEEIGCCCGSAPKAENTCCCGKNTIKVLGSGCKNCHDLYEASKTAVQNLGLAIEVEYVTDMEKIMEYGVMSMPALVVNEKVVSMGKVLKATDVEKLLHKLGF